jgi:hypothetical protein
MVKFVTAGFQALWAMLPDGLVWVEQAFRPAENSPAQEGFKPLKGTGTSAAEAGDISVGSMQR